MTLIELLVGLAIGSFVVLGAVMVYNQSRTTYALNETQARLQENGRYALSLIEPDVQLAGYLGYSNEASDFYWYTSASSRTSVMDLESNDTAKTSPSVIGACGTNFVVDLLQTVQGSDGSVDGGPVAVSTCLPSMAAGNNAGAWESGTDTLTIRRASTETVAASAAKIQLYLNRLKRTNQSIFNAAAAPGTIDANREVRDLIVRTYYVATNSTTKTGLPSLWRKTLGTASGAPAMLDEEILPGVEDFQVEFGIDTADHDSTVGIDAAQDKVPPTGVPDYFTGVVSRWVAPNSTLLDLSVDGRKSQIVAVRVWLRIRADKPEVGYTDTRTYTYAGSSPTIATALKSYRRVLVSRTMYLRNVRFQ
jgi:type IV pilus assembly protein PilW